jgi:hypothetical protein
VTALTSDMIDEVERRCSMFAAFEFELRQVVSFGEVLFIAPDPAEPFRELLRTLTTAEPLPPYPGR